jgi:hypothetical protein
LVPARCDVHGAGGSEFGGQVQAGLADLKFLDGADGNILRGRSDRLVGNVEPVDFYARGAAKSPAEGDRGKTLLGGIEISAVLNLYAGFELRQVQEISPVNRQVFDLRAGNDSLDGGLVGVHGYRGTLDGDNGSFGADLQRDICGCDVSDLYGDGLLDGAKTGGFDAHEVFPGNQRPGAVGARARHLRRLLRSRAFTGDRNLGIRN